MSRKIIGIWTLLGLLISFFPAVAVGGTGDSLSSKGSVVFRNALMTTDNDKGNDYLADVQAAIFKTSFKYGRFSFGGRLTVLNNVYNNDLLRIDPNSGKTAKWELEMYDLERKRKCDGIYRLDEAYLGYQDSTSVIKAGMQILDNPLINPRDGRVLPYSQGGITFSHRFAHNTRLEAGWITHVSRRGTAEWHTWSDAWGRDNNGFLPSGQKANYRFIPSSGVGFAGFVHGDTIRKIKTQIWDYYIQNELNTFLIQLDHSNKWIYGIQFAAQQGLNSSDTQYFPSQQSYVFSGRFGYKFRKWRVSLNHTWVTDHGRYTFPRELGRGKFYTSFSRSWLDGYGNAHISTIRGQYKRSDTAFLSYNLYATVIHGPGLNIFKYNKYNLPRYWQVNGELRFRGRNTMDGWDLYILLIRRQNLPGETTDPKLIFNRTNFNQVYLRVEYELGLWGRSHKK